MVRVQAGGGVRSTKPLLKAWCEQQPRRARRGGRMTTSYTISLLCHPFGVVDFISSSSRGYASLHHLPVVVPALRASLHNRLPYEINYSFVRQFYFRNLRSYSSYNPHDFISWNLKLLVLFVFALYKKRFLQNSLVICKKRLIFKNLKQLLFYFSLQAKGFCIIPTRWLMVVLMRCRNTRG